MLGYLEIKDFPTEIAPIIKGGSQIVSWWQSGELLKNERDALLIGVNAAAYAVGVGADAFSPHLPQLFAASPERTADSIASELQSKVGELEPSDGVPVMSISPLVILQIAQLVFQLIRTLKS